jgi:hypothetical protein
MEADPNMGEGRDDDSFNDLLELLLEKEPLVQHLDQSKEFMETKIQKMETEIMKAINTEWKDTESTMSLKQHKRNRGIIKEIITTCNMFRSEIKEEFTNLRGEEEEI